MILKTAMSNTMSEDTKDYSDFLVSMNMTDKKIEPYMFIDLDIRGTLPKELEIRESKTHGKGIFAKEILKAGTYFIAYDKLKHRTPTARYLNHAKNPNCMMIHIQGFTYLVTLNHTPKDTELTVNYMQVALLQKNNY